MSRCGTAIRRAQERKNHERRSSVGRSGRLTDSPNRLLGTVFGVVYLLIGLLGFAYTGFSSPHDDGDGHTHDGGHGH